MTNILSPDLRAEMDALNDQSDTVTSPADAEAFQQLRKELLNARDKAAGDLGKTASNELLGMPDGSIVPKELVDKERQQGHELDGTYNANRRA